MQLHLGIPQYGAQFLFTAAAPFHSKAYLTQYFSGEVQGSYPSY